MSFKNLSRVGYLFGVSVICAADSTVDLTFLIQPGSEVQLTGNISGSSSATDTASIQGSYDARVVFDPQDLTIQNVTFEGGTIEMGDLDLQFSGNVVVPGYGQFLLSVRAETEGIIESIDTPSAPGDVLSDGNLISSQHELTTYDGVLRLTASVLGETEVEITDYEAVPETETASGTAHISVVRVSSDFLEERFRFTLLTNTSENTTEGIDGTTNTMTLSGSETTSSLAEVTLRTAFGEWVYANGLNLTSEDDNNAHGLSYRLLYAFGLEADASRLPIDFVKGSSDELKIRITLPSSGLEETLYPMYRTSLSEGQWEALAEANILSGSDSLEAGNTGDVELSFPAGASGFLRLQL